MGKTPAFKLSESTIQENIVEALSRLAVQNQFFFFSVPNERVFTRTKGQQIARLNKLKRMGLLPGCADLVIIKGGGAYFLEVKSATGKPSENQKIFYNTCVVNGARYAIAHSVREALGFLKLWRIISIS